MKRPLKDLPKQRLGAWHYQGLFSASATALGRADASRDPDKISACYTKDLTDGSVGGGQPGSRINDHCSGTGIIR